MPITNKYIGISISTTSLSTWTSALSSGPDAGQRSVVWVSTDNIATTDGPSNTHTGFSGEGLTWTKVGETTASGGVAGDGVTISVWISAATVGAIGTLDFTVTFSGAVTMKAAQGRAFGGAALGIDATALRTNYAATAYGSMAISGLSSTERAYLRMSVGEYGASTNATATDGTWTVGTGANVGSTTSGLMSRSELKIATSTGETSAFTQNIAVDSASIFIALSEGGGGSTPVAFTGTVSNQTGAEGSAFSLNLATFFSGTATPFAYTVQSGTLPAGLSLNASTGVISGTPTTVGVSSGIVIRATDATPNTADTNSFSITVNAVDTTAPTLTTPTAAATGATTYTGTVSTNEASGTLYWLANSSATATAVEVKAGASQAVTATGVQNVSGSGLTASTPYYVHYLHRDASGNDSTVSASAQFTTAAANTGPVFDGPNIDTLNSTQSVALTGPDVSGLFSDAESALTFSAIGSWPAGVTVSSAGVISGTPTTVGTYSGLQVRATDTGALTADTNSFSIIVAAPSAYGTITVGSALYPIRSAGGSPINESGVRVCVLNALTMAPVYSAAGRTIVAGVMTISEDGIVAGTAYHVATKIGTDWIGMSDVVTAA